MSGIINQVGARSGIVGLDVYPTGHIIQTKISNTANFVTGETDFAGDNITIRGNFSMACTAGNTLVTQLCVGGYSVALTGNEDVWYGKLGIGVSDPGATNGTSYSYLGNNSGTGTVKYYSSNGEANERTHGLSWTNVLQPTVTGTYYLFFLVYRGGAAGNLTLGLNTSTQYIAQEFQGDCLV